MSFDDLPASGHNPPATKIFSRIKTVISEARLSRGRLGIDEDQQPPALFLGEAEWRDLCQLCAVFEVKWAGSNVDGYYPAENEKARAMFEDFRIYRVDSKTFLLAL